MTFELIAVQPEGYQSAQGAHRYLLTFSSKSVETGSSVAIIQMNGSMVTPGRTPSTWRSDPTTGKVLAWCSRQTDLCIKHVHLLNLFSYVEKDPGRLRDKTLEELNRPENDEYIKRICQSSDYVILAYGDGKGVHPTLFRRRVQEIYSLVKGVPLMHVGPLTKKKNPRHGRNWNGSPSAERYLMEPQKAK